MTQPPLLEAALGYAQRGWPVFPVVPRSKLPKIKDWPDTATTDPEQISRWWRATPSANVGIVTGGRSGLVVVDVDPGRGGQVERLLAEYPTGSIVRTGGGGFHLYYAAPDHEVRNRVTEKGLDVRGERGFVVAPPSVHKSGGVYEWQAEGELGTHLPPLATHGSARPKPPASDDEWAELWRGVERGRRHQAALQLAGHLAAKRFSETELLGALEGWNRQNRPPLGDDPDDDPEELRKIATWVIEQGHARRDRFASEVEVAAIDERPVTVSMEELLENPQVMELPRPIVPLAVWEGHVTLFSSREKAGKSTFACAAAAAVSAGGLFLGEPATQGSVLYVSVPPEGSLPLLVVVLSEFGAMPSQVHLAFRLDRLVASPFPELRAAVEATQPRLVIVDSLAAFGQRLDVESGDARRWTDVMSQFVLLVRDTETGLLLLHHARKKDNKYRDSTAIGAGVDVLLEMDWTNEPEVRAVAASGRWQVDDYAYRLVRSDGWQLRLVDGQPLGLASLDDRVLRFVEEHPGAGTGRIMKEVSGRNEEVLRELRRQEELGAVRKEVKGQAHTWYPVEQQFLELGDES